MQDSSPCNILSRCLWDKLTANEMVILSIKILNPARSLNKTLSTVK